MNCVWGLLVIVATYGILWAVPGPDFYMSFIEPRTVNNGNAEGCASYIFSFGASEDLHDVLITISTPNPIQGLDVGTPSAERGLAPEQRKSASAFAYGKDAEGRCTVSGAFGRKIEASRAQYLLSIGPLDVPEEMTIIGGIATRLPAVSSGSGMRVSYHYARVGIPIGKVKTFPLGSVQMGHRRTSKIW